jgi:hypothetical protein
VQPPYQRESRRGAVEKRDLEPVLAAATTQSVMGLQTIYCAGLVPGALVRCIGLWPKSSVSALEIPILGSGQAFGNGSDSLAGQFWDNARNWRVQTVIVNEGLVVGGS